MTTVVTQYKTKNGFYINHYSDGKIGIALSGEISYGDITIGGKPGLRFNIYDQTVSGYVEFALGVKGQSIGPYSVATKTIYDLFTG